MDPESLLAVLALALFSVVVWLLALPAGWAWLRAHDPERLAWWRLMFPLFAGALVFAFLVGWAAQEADPADERAGLALRALALCGAGVLLRASLRAAQALWSAKRARVAIGTLGVVAPHIVVSDAFRGSVSNDVLAAALAHEASHVRRRDPLRIWLAQLAADLQWPVPGTARRFSTWLLALEAARDDEALASGAREEDLAEAILMAARLHAGQPAPACAHAAGSGEGVAWRVRRLLEDGPTTKRPATLRSWIVNTSCLALVLLAGGLGHRFGDLVLRVLPGISP